MSPTPPPASDPERSHDLVRRAQLGDREAFDALIRRNEARLIRLVRKRMGKELRQVEESGDVVQSALAEAVRALPRFEYRGEGSFLRWLGTIVEHEVLHHVRDLRREKRRPDAAAPMTEEPCAVDPSPSAVAAGKEVEARYQGAIETASAEDKELLLLHLELGCSHAEIAEALGIESAEAVRKRVARALVRLEQAMRSRPA